MASLIENSAAWAYLKVTIANPAASQQASDIGVRSCRVWHFSGTATFMSYTTATTSDIPLPTTAATALSMPVENLNELYFIGTAGDVVMIMYRK